MPSGDYTAVTGGALKLKGSKVSKHKKDKKRAQSESSNAATKSSSQSKDTTAKAQSDSTSAKSQSNIIDTSSQPADSIKLLRADNASAGTGVGSKTAAQLRHEAHRRQRLADRLQREGGGSKSHKERVEDLNRYLSRLSEHHDMPRIGPG